jgi:hypothetical protein
VPTHLTLQKQVYNISRERRMHLQHEKSHIETPPDSFQQDNIVYVAKSMMK